MKQIKIVLALVLFMGLVSCTKTEVSFDENNLYGYWQEDGKEEFLRFLKAEEDTIDGEYKFGYEWDESEDVQEPDVVKDYHGNGWFKWKLIQSTLTQIHLMSIREAAAPKLYTVKKLTDSELQLQDKDNKDDIEYFHKVVRTNTEIVK